MNQKQYGKSNPKPPFKKFGAKQAGTDKKKPHVIKVNTPKLPKEWFFMSTKEIGVDQIHTAIAEMKEFDVEVWNEMGVLEITMGEESRMDFELLETDLGDEYSNDFLKEHEVASLYAVSVKDVSEDIVKKIMKQVCSQVEGFFCGDTDDFEPVIK